MSASGRYRIFSIMLPRVDRFRFAARLQMSIAITTLMTIGITTSAFAGQPLASVVIRDSTVYAPAELFAVYEQHLGKPVTDTTATAIGGSLQQMYLEDGYSRPAYAILDGGSETGIARIRLVEPRISNVRITGDAGPWRARLESLVAGLDSQQSLRPADVRDALRRARRLPGLEVNVATEPDADPGAYLLSLDSTFKAHEGGVTLSNRGTQEIGRTLLTARLVSHGALASESSIGAFVTTARDSDDYRGGGVFANSALGERGATVRLQAAVTSLEIESQGIPLGQRRERFLFHYSRPVLESHERELALRVGLDVENLDLVQAGLVSREERLRSVEAGLLFNQRSGNGQRLTGFDIEKGLRGFGSRIDHFLLPNNVPEFDFTIAKLRYVHLHRLSETLTLRWDAFAQHSPNVLPSIKRFKVGGGRIGRGFEAAAASGDRGIGNKLELKRRVGDAVGWLERADLYGYFDLGTTWRNDGPDRESASSTGIGIAWTTDSLSGYVELAQPLTHADADGRGHASVFAELAWRF